MRTVEQSVSAYNDLRTQDVARRLGVHRTHVLDLIRAKELPALNIGLGKRPRYRISEADLDEFIRRRKVA